jgi:transposase
MKTLSVDLRERILDAYDEGEGTREDVARRFRVSLGMVKKLLAQRRRTGDIAARHRHSGRKPRLGGAEHREMRALLAGKPDLTLEELRARAGLQCALPTIHRALAAMGLTYKKRHSAPPSKTVRTSRVRDGAGSAARADSTRRGSSSSTNPARRRT